MGILFPLLAISVLALNIDFPIDVEDRIFLPNETISINFSLISRDAYTARDVNLTLNISQRSYFYQLGDIKPSGMFSDNLTLPEFPPGDYVIYGKAEYVGFFDEKGIKESYNSFHVKFPDLERFPRNIVIKKFIIPENITAGETYTVSIIVSNEGNIAGDLIVSVNSMDVDKSKEIHLEPSELDTINLDVTFYNSGLSNVEARVYAIVNDVKYLLSFDTATVFVKESKVAKLLLDKIELVDESDNKINQNDMVKLKISLLNNGTWLASDVKGILKSSISEIEIIQPEGDFKLIVKNGLSNSIFEIKTSDANIGSAELTLDVSYTDGLGDHSTSIGISLTISEGSEACNYDSDCTEKQTCSNKRCVAVPCECGEVINHQCHPYACCDDFDCEEGYTCSSETHKCEPLKEIRADVLIVTSSKLKTNDEYNKALKDYRKTILEEDLSSFYIMVDSQKVQDLFNIHPAYIDDWRSVKSVVDKIIYKIEPDYLLILGGVDIIPQPPAKTTAEIPTIPPSDDIYTDLNLDGIPDIASGRIPIDDVDFINDYLFMLTEAHKKAVVNNKIIIGDACGGHNCFLYKDIDYTSEFIFGTNCEQSSNCLKSPPYCSGRGLPPIFPIPCEKKDEMMVYIKNSDFIFFGAHGDGTIFGSIEDEMGLIGDIILSGNQIYNMDFDGKVIMTFACFGGSIDVSSICLLPGACIYSKLQPSGSTALASIYKKSIVYIGNTRYGYGGAASAKRFKEIYNEIENGQTVGNAVLKMKRNKLSTAYHEFDKAITYEIQLYGDPTLKLIGV